MIIDCHYHYYSDEFQIPEKLKSMDEAGIDRIALIPSVSVDFPSDPEKPIMRFMRFLFGKRTLYPLLRKLMVTFNGDGINITGRHYPIYFHPNNEVVFAAAEKAPDRLYSYVFVNPDLQSQEELCTEIERYAKRKTFCGVKAHPFYHQYSTGKLEGVCEILDSIHKPLLIHMNFEAKDEILRLADRHPTVNFLLAHCAFPYYELLWPELRKRKNVYVDISSGCYVDGKTALLAVKSLGADHVLYGSDGPYGTRLPDGTFNMQAEYTWATRALPVNVLQAVCAENFLSLQ